MLFAELINHSPKTVREAKSLPRTDVIRSTERSLHAHRHFVGFRNHRVSRYRSAVTPQSILIVAGEASGDQLAAELVSALRQASGPIAPVFFGAGGPAMAAVGVEVLHDMSCLSAIGPADALRQYWAYRRVFNSLLSEARNRTPSLVVGVDFGAFNLRLFKALRPRYRRPTPFLNWFPKTVQFVSPQVWASRPWRTDSMVPCLDLLLSILPFETEWYAKHAPEVPVRFVGHPLVDRHSRTPPAKTSPRRRQLLLLPGSRPGELRRHWPVMATAAEEVRRKTGILPVLVLPTESSRAWLPEAVTPPLGLEIHIGNLAEELSRTEVAIASTGTVTLECAWFTVPTVALYRTSWSTYQIGRQIINVPYLALPNILANKAVIPEFIQDAATPSAIAEAVIQLLNDPVLRSKTVTELERVRELLGVPGACRRAADAILELSRASD